MEAAAFLCGPLPLARRVFYQVWLRQQVETSGVLSLPYRPQKQQNLPVLDRPVPILSRLNRSPVFPTLVLPEAILPCVRLSAILEVVRQAFVEGEPWPRLLDVLVTSSGLDWSAGTGILEPIIGRSLPEEAVSLVAGARHFWQNYARGRARVVALQEAQELPVRKGDWAYFDRAQFAELLPGATLPDHFERHQFLANFLHKEPGLDLYCISGRPLVRHPFTPRFRALI